MSNKYYDLTYLSLQVNTIIVLTLFIVAMNIILVLVDSLNKSALKTYNPETICETPNLEEFAKKSLIFENHYISSLPCMPARREIFAGRKEFMWRPWGPLEIFDPRMPRIIQSAGYNTGIVTDHYHYWEETSNGYIQGFASSKFIRGHETDFWKMHDDKEVPKWVKKMSEFRASEHMNQYYANVKDFDGEEDFFPAKTFSAACDWLEENSGNGDFFLHIESFDVHEPFHVPEPYASMYTDGSSDDFNIWPPYQIYDDLEKFMDQTSNEELQYLESQYMGKTTMADKWFGHLCKQLDRLSLWDNTMVIFTTDHGHDLGIRRSFGKQYPHYDSHANIPLFIWHPKFCGNGKRVNTLTQNVDLFATLVDASGSDIPDTNRHSKSLLPIVKNPEKTNRKVILYGTYGQGVCLNDGEWTLFCSPVKDKQLYNYSTMILRPLIVDNPVDGRVGDMPNQPIDQGFFDETVPYPLWKMPIKIDPRTYENFLFNRKKDPHQKENLWDTEVKKRNELLRLLRSVLDEEGYPAEQLDRLNLTDEVLNNLY